MALLRQEQPAQKTVGNHSHRGNRDHFLDLGRPAPRVPRLALQAQNVRLKYNVPNKNYRKRAHALRKVIQCLVFLPK